MNRQPSSLAGKPTICLVAHKAYGAINGGRSGKIGGVEWQTSLMAVSLAKAGYDISMLTWDEGGPPVESINGVRVIKIARQSAGLKGLRFIHPKWTGLVKAMRQANADIYYHNCAECVTGQMALWCWRAGKKMVFSTCNDTECNGELPDLSPWDRVFYLHGLRYAHARVVQTSTQQSMLERHYGLESTVIPMPSPAPEGWEPRAGDADALTRVLWIARVCKQKRPDRLLDLAEACPDLSFDVVGPFYEDDYAQQVVQRARRIRNVTLHGPVNRENVPSFYRNAACLCCTSDYEGFPNTFLEAWSHGLPILSTFDPDSLIARKNLGIVARTVPELAAAIRALVADPARRAEISRNARDYFMNNHRLETVLPKFEQVFARVMGGRPEAVAAGKQASEVNMMP